MFIIRIFIYAELIELDITYEAAWKTSPWGKGQPEKQGSSTSWNGHTAVGMFKRYTFKKIAILLGSRHETRSLQGEIVGSTQWHVLLVIFHLVANSLYILLVGQKCSEISSLTGGSKVVLWSHSMQQKTLVNMNWNPIAGLWCWMHQYMRNGWHSNFSDSFCADTALQALKARSLRSCTSQAARGSYIRGISFSLCAQEISEWFSFFNVLRLSQFAVIRGASHPSVQPKKMTFNALLLIV